MFNFLEEIKKKASKGKVISDYNILVISGCLVYVEGHIGVTVILPQLVAFKVKGSRYEIAGKNLSIRELTENTFTVEGEIDEVKKS